MQLNPDKFTNIYMPGVTNSKTLENIVSTQFRHNTTLRLVMGQRGKSNKKDVIQYVKQFSIFNLQNILVFLIILGESYQGGYLIKLLI